MKDILHPINGFNPTVGRASIRTTKIIGIKLVHAEVRQLPPAAHLRHPETTSPAGKGRLPKRWIGMDWYETNHGNKGIRKGVVLFHIQIPQQIWCNSQWSQCLNGLNSPNAWELQKTRGFWTFCKMVPSDSWSSKWYIQGGYFDAGHIIYKYIYIWYVCIYSKKVVKHRYFNASSSLAPWLCLFR